jgi:hypothetical protein
MQVKTEQIFQTFNEAYYRLGEYIGWHYGRVLYGVNFDFRADGCRIILKATRGGRGEIAFINASSSERCFEVLEAFVTSDADVGVKWKTDKYYKP